MQGHKILHPYIISKAKFFYTAHIFFVSFKKERDFYLLNRTIYSYPT